MTITVEATYENGSLKLSQPLPLEEHEKVQVTVTPLQKSADKAPELVRGSYGLIGWKGTHEELEQILAEAEELEDLP